MDDERWNSYFLPGTDVLKNKIGIDNNDELKQFEKENSTKKLIELYLNPITGKFDAKHLCNIHKFIFEDIYDFAGQYRTVNMGKEYTSSFCDYHLIENNLNELLSDIDSKILNIAHSEMLYADALARVYHDLIYIHPFREGNGRTIREFMREYVEANNKYFSDFSYQLDFSKVDKDKFLHGTVGPKSCIGELTLEFFNALVKTNKNIKTK